MQNIFEFLTLLTFGCPNHDHNKDVLIWFLSDLCESFVTSNNYLNSWDFLKLNEVLEQMPNYKWLLVMLEFLL